MMSVWHLLWIIPLTMFLTIMMMALCQAAKSRDVWEIEDEREKYK